jgi:glutathione peroxidase
MLDRLRSTATHVMSSLMHGKSPESKEGGNLNDLPLTRLDGTPLGASELADQVVLFVNVASRCGLTPQYAELVELQRSFGPRGFTVVGVPCNQFLGQEPGSAEEIASFCSATYGVDFPLLEKQDVNGPGRSALYRWLVGNSGDPTAIAWNFEKFLVDRSGRVVGRFPPRTLPSAPEVRQAIEQALGV